MAQCYRKKGEGTGKPRLMLPSLERQRLEAGGPQARAQHEKGEKKSNFTVKRPSKYYLKPGFCSVRHGLALIVHLCNFSISTQQMNMSIALPAMLNNTAPPNPPSISTERPPTDFQDNWNETLNEFKAVAATYDRSPEIQGIIPSSLNYGSFLAPIPSGYLAEIFGTKYLAGAGMFITSVLTLFTPLAADTGVTLLIVLQIIQGIVQSGMLSALPFVSACICIVPGGLLADFLLSRKILRLNTIRKLFTAIGVLFPSAFFVSLFWVRSSFSTTMAFLILSSATKSLSQSGALVNFMDIAPRSISSPFKEQATKTCGNWDSAIWKTGLKPSFTG
ncbi:putative small intestine urate exporter, partial [Eschrichtius robustus]|nr:putative small intestine urate exporter [Eschrichtius robustus]